MTVIGPASVVTPHDADNDALDIAMVDDDRLEGIIGRLQPNSAIGFSEE